MTLSTSIKNAKLTITLQRVLFMLSFVMLSVVVTVSRLPNTFPRL